VLYVFLGIYFLLPIILIYVLSLFNIQ